MAKHVLVWYREGETTALQHGRFGKVYGHDGSITQMETQETNRGRREIGGGQKQTEWVSLPVVVGLTASDEGPHSLW